MMRFNEWLKYRRWVANVARAKRWRDELGFSGRQKFDDALRPRVVAGCIAYPDALYHITIEDLIRAMKASAYDRHL